MSPDIVKCPWEARSPLAENHCSVGVDRRVRISALKSDRPGYTPVPSEWHSPGEVTFNEEKMVPIL